MRERLPTALKLFCTAALLWWLLARTDLSSIAAALGGARLQWVCAAFSLHIVGLTLSAVRWQQLLRAQGTSVPLWSLAKSLVVGIFFNNFFLSTVGGDLMRVRDTAVQAGSGARALTVVLVERTSGILVLGIFALAAPLAGYRAEGPAWSPAIWATGALLVSLVSFVLLLRPRPLAALRRAIEVRVASWPRAPSAATLGRVDAVLLSLEALARSPGVLFTTFVLALLLQGTVIVHYWCVAMALGLEVPAGAFLWIVPLATILLLLPVSINGLGAREAVFVFLLGRYGVALPQALAFTWIAYGTVLVQGLLGGLTYALRRRI